MVSPSATPIRAELSDIEKREIEAEAAHYPYRRSLGIEALKVVQKHRGWVSDASLEALSRYLEIPEAELESVATFYNLIFRRPVGRHVILVCDSVCCWICGGTNLSKHISDSLGIQPGETTSDGCFTLLPIVCLGDCDRAPTLMIDDQQYGNQTPESVDHLLAQLAVQDREAQPRGPSSPPEEGGPAHE